MSQIHRRPIDPCLDASHDRCRDVFRLLDVSASASQAGGYDNTAQTYLAENVFVIHWDSRQMPVLASGSLVYIQNSLSFNMDSSLFVRDLVEATTPTHVNLFLTVPQSWVADRSLLQRGSDLWEQLTPEFQYLFNSIFWSSGRFFNYLCGPSSYNDHHNRRHGNFVHALEVAETALRVAQCPSRINTSVLIMAALLHDVGKAGEYNVSKNGTHGGWSDEGSLLGHRLIGFSWVEQALALHEHPIPTHELLSLRHALVATEGIASWTGFPQPRTLEAVALAGADRFSARADLFHRLSRSEVGLGRSHPNLKFGPYLSMPK